MGLEAGWSPAHCARSRVETNPNHQSRITRQESERVSPNPENQKPGGVPAVQGDCLLRAALHLPSGEERHHPQAAVHRGDPEQGNPAPKEKEENNRSSVAYGFFSSARNGTLQKGHLMSPFLAVSKAVHFWPGGLEGWAGHRAPVVLQVKPHS